MLKTRVIPTLLFRDHGLVKGKGFHSWRRVGSALPAVRVYNMRQVDELIFVDITATAERRPPDLDTVRELADECFMPLTVGGGIRTVHDVENLLKAGADKIALNSAAIERPALIREVSERFGAQCVVVSIDARRENDASYLAVTHAGTKPSGREVCAFAREAESLGAGEILITSIERDGMLSGYDIELVASVSSSVKIPVIAAGGAGTPDHFVDVVKRGKASAVAAGAIFHFTEVTPLEVKQHLSAHGIETRLTV